MPAQEEEKAPPAPPHVDLQVVARVARYMELKEIRLAELTAAGTPRPRKPLEPRVSHQCTPTRHEGRELEVTCSYQFTVHAAEKEGDRTDPKKEIARADFKYVVVYSVETDEVIPEPDLQQF